MPKVKFGWEPIASIRREPNLQDLILEHYEELARFKHLLRPALNFDLMHACEERGEFKLWSARVDGLLAGGIMWWLHRHPNFWNSGLRATDGGHYLAPQFRGRGAGLGTKGSIGFQMWKAVIPELKALGVNFIDAHDNASHPLGPFFRRLGMTPYSTHYGKEL